MFQWSLSKDIHNIILHKHIKQVSRFATLVYNIYFWRNHSL